MNLQKMIALFMDYCRSKQLRTKTMDSYERTLKLFARWLEEEMNITNVQEVKETHIRACVLDLQQRGKYTFFVNDRSQNFNHPSHRRDYREAVSVVTINNYLRMGIKKRQPVFRRLPLFCIGL